MASEMLATQDAIQSPFNINRQNGIGQGVKEDSIKSDEEEPIEEEIYTGEHESPLINAKTKA